MRILKRLCALLALCLLPVALSACRPILDPGFSAAPTPAPSPTPGFTGRWEGRLAAGESPEGALGLDLSSSLPEPPQAALLLDVDASGRCALRCDYAPCAEALRPALADRLRALWAQEGEPYPGADADEIAAALLAERTPPTLLLTGTLSPDSAELRWDLGAASPLTLSGDTLTLHAPELGELRLNRAGS